MGRVFNFRNGHVHVVHFLCYGLKLPNLKLKTQPKQLLGLLPLDITFPEIRLDHPLDGITNPMYKLLHFSTTNKLFYRESH